jgi:hypothetical protein
MLEPAEQALHVVAVVVQVAVFLVFEAAVFLLGTTAFAPRAST